MATTAGLDLGNGSCCITVCNEFHETNVFVNPETWTSDLSYEYSTADLNVHFSQIKCLLGHNFSDPELQSDLGFLPFRVIKGPDDSPLIHVNHLGVDRAFTPIAILAMLISKLVREPSYPYTCRRTKPHISSLPCCIGVPIYFTDRQRKDVLEAAKLAGLTSPSLLDETAAMALAYNNSWEVPEFSIQAFVDIGHVGMQVCLYGPDILYQAYFSSLGGRNFTKVLFVHFVSMIRKRYNIDVYQSAKACIRLNDACEDLKKQLSESDKASFRIENFSGSINVMGSTTRKDFENMSAPIIKRMKEAWRMYW